MARHRRGNRKTHRQAWTAQQEAKVRQAVEEGRFRTAGEVVRWCAEAPGIEAPYWLRRWGYRKKVPRPLAERADMQAQEAWKKERLVEALRQQEVRQGDEMRAELHGQSRRVWGKRGEKVRQRVECGTSGPIWFWEWTRWGSG